VAPEMEGCAFAGSTTSKQAVMQKNANKYFTIVGFIVA